VLKPAEPFRRPVVAKSVLDGIERWAAGYHLLRETGAVIANGRLDGVLVPVGWETRARPGIYGVEVKVSRTDFLRGLNGGQFDRYLAKVNCLYLATGPDVCKTAEVPLEIGYLVVGFRGNNGLNPSK